MEVIREAGGLIKRFDNIAIGQVFEYNKNIYIKIDLAHESEFDAFNVTKNECRNISEETFVIPLDAKLVIG